MFASVVRWIKDSWHARRLRHMLRKLGIERHLHAWNQAQIPFPLGDAKHSVLILLDRDDLKVEGVSGLVFQVGQVPRSLAGTLVRRNGHLTGLSWSLTRALGSEWFSVGSRQRFAEVSLSALKTRICAVVEELERCRQALSQVERRFGVRQSFWRM